MFQRILVPLDGSVRAEQALPAAAGIARAFGGMIILLCVVPPDDWLRKVKMPEAYPRMGTDEQLANKRRLIRDLLLWLWSKS